MIGSTNWLLDIELKSIEKKNAAIVQLQDTMKPPQQRKASLALAEFTKLAGY